MTLPATLSGLHRATVQSLADPNAAGRVGVILDSYPADLLWAMPCVPYAGTGVGLRLMPQVGDEVWIAFENDSAADPVWVGSFWSTPPSEDPEIRYLRTHYGRISIDDRVGEEKLTIEAEDGSRLEMKKNPDPLLTLEEPGGGRIEMTGGEVRLKGWPLKFSPPSEAVLARLEALETEVARLRALVEAPDPGS